MMDVIRELKNIDWWTIFISVITICVCFKFLYELFEWINKRFGIETKTMREKREMKTLLDTTNDLAKQTSTSLSALQKMHIAGEESFRKRLEEHIVTSNSDIKSMHDEILEFEKHREHDRDESLKIQQELSNSIKEITDKQNDRDKKIKDLTDMFVDKQISDYRWEIINLADKISNKKIVSKECLRHAISTHAKYEQIIEEQGFTNGEVEISMEIINEEYKRILSESSK